MASCNFTTNAPQPYSLREKKTEQLVTPKNHSSEWTKKLDKPLFVDVKGRSSPCGRIHSMKQEPQSQA